jgi:hypothetical protein
VLVKMKRTALIAALVLASTTQAYQLKQDSTGTEVRWNGPVGFVVDAKIADTLQEPLAMDAVQAAAESFSDVENLTVTVTAGKTTGVGFDRNGGKNQNEIVALEDWPFDSNFIAATVVTMDARTHKILDADIALNVKNHKFKVLNDKANGGVHDDIQNTLTHEMGHALGLAHNPAEEHAVMYPSAAPGEIRKRQLSDDDRNGLLALYAGGVTNVEADKASMGGCSSTNSDISGFGLIVLALAAVSLKKRRLANTAVVLASLTSSVAMASEARQTANLKSSRAAYTAEVRAIRTVVSTKSKLLISEVELTVRSCLKGNCPKTITVVVPGGRSGDIEQVVMGRPVPTQGDVLGVTEGAPKAATSSSAMSALTLGVTSAQRAPASIYRLTDPEDFQAFASGVSETDAAPPAAPATP